MTKTIRISVIDRIASDVSVVVRLPARPSDRALGNEARTVWAEVASTIVIEARTVVLAPDADETSGINRSAQSTTNVPLNASISA